MKKSFLNSKAFLISIGAVTAGGAATGIYFLARKQDKETIKYDFYSESFDNYFNVKVAYNSNLTPYFNQDELKDFVVELKKVLQIGPEVTMLNDIVIDDMNIVDSNVNGLFIGAVNKIYLNTNDYRQKLPANASFSARKELALETIFHEYNHFIANTYLTSTLKGTPVFGIGHKEQWNTSFYNAWKKWLGYDTEGTLVEDGWTDTKDGKVYTLLQNKYSSDMLFNQINEQSSRDLISREDEDIWNIAKSILHTTKPLDDEYVNYVYSLQELYARKVHQMSFLPDYSSKELTAEGWIKNGDAYYVSGFLSDRLMYEIPTHANQSISTMDDNPFTTNPNEIYDNIRELEGQKNDADISLISFINNSHMIEKGKYIPDLDTSKVILGGYENKDYESIATLSNGKFQKISDISQDDFNFRVKHSLYGTDPLDANYYNEKISRFWVVDPVDVNLVLNKELYLVNENSDIDDETSFKKVSDELTGTRVVSTYIDKGPIAKLSIDDHIYIDKSTGMLVKGNPFK